MFCIECGQPMADEAKFCAYCGTRRAIPAAVREVTPASQPSVPEPPRVVPPAASTIRPPAEITPIRGQRPAATPPAPPAYIEPPQPPDTVVPWPEREEAAPSLFSTPAPVPVHEEVPRQHAPEPPRTAATVQPGYRSVPFAAEPGVDSGNGRRKISPVLIGAIIVALIAIAGIFWMVRTSMSGAGKPSETVAITIYPTSAKVVAGKSVDFVAEVTGAPASEVTWTVEEGDSGGEIRSRGASAKDDRISLYCTYLAPKAPGTYHLVATSTADKSKSATAEIAVTAK